MTVKEFNTIVDEHADGLYRFILKNVRDEDRAKDIVQDTYEKVWKKHEDVAVEKAKSYLFTAAYHTMLDELKKANRIDRNYEPEELHITYTNSQPDLKKVVNDALERLPEQQKHVILLRDYEGYDYAQIGEITGLSESQVKVYIYRARITLKEYIVKLENVL